MRESTSRTVPTKPNRWQYRIGLRFLLVTVCFVGLILGWVSREHREANRRTALVAELSGVGVEPLLEEPTGFGQIVKKVLPKYEQPIIARIGRGWFDRPTVFVCRQLLDDRVPFAVERLKLLGTVREIHTQGPGLSERGISELRSGLPDVAVVPSANPALHRYFHDQVGHEHLATEGLQLAGLLLLCLLGTLVFFAWPLVRRRRPRALCKP
jgi:hypothetical protein